MATARLTSTKVLTVDREVGGPAPDARPGGGGSKSGGTVRRVALTMPSEFAVSGSPIKQTGTLVVSKAVQAANLVAAGPASGPDAAWAFRALVAADLGTGLTPQFARLGLGVAAHATFALDAVGALRFLPGVNQALRILRDSGAPSVAFRNEADTLAYAEFGYDHTDNEFFTFLTGTTRAISFWTNSSKRMLITAAGNIVLGGQAALATTAADGFAYVPTCAGTPTGTPTAYTGKSPLVVDSTNHKLYFYSGGAWRDAGP